LPDSAANLGRPTRIALALGVGIFLTVWFSSSVLRWMPALQYAFCSPRGPLCTVGTLMFAFVYYSAATLPVASLLLAALLTLLFDRPAPGGGERPLGVSLAVVMLLASALFLLVGFVLDLGVRLQPGGLAVVAAPSLMATLVVALASLVAAWLLWRLQERGRRLAIAMLAVMIGTTLFTVLHHPAGLRQSPVLLLVLALRVALVGYLMTGGVKARFTPAAAT